MGTGVAIALGLLLCVLLLVRIAWSLRRAFQRPGPTVAAVQAFSLSTGRGMLLIAVGGVILLPTRAQKLNVSFPAVVGVIGILAVLLHMAAETRWPRQVGSIRVAQLRRLSLNELVAVRYRVGVVATGGLALLAVPFFLVLNPAVTPESRAVCDPVRCLPGMGVPAGFAQSAPGAGSVLIALAILAVMAVLAGFAVRQVLVRPVLSGVGPAIDQYLRRVAAERLCRAISAACLAFIAGMAGELENALQSGPYGSGTLPTALANAMTWVEIATGFGVLLLYIVGPNASRMRKSVARTHALQT
jgi:hypothetical protein